jgi:hypothetical protein
LLKAPAKWPVLPIEGINESELINILNVSIGVDAINTSNVRRGREVMRSPEILEV